MKRSNEKKDFKIKFSNEAFNVAFARSNLSNEMKPYTQRILEMNEAVEALDRYDDFADLKVQERVARLRYPRVKNGVSSGREAFS